MRLIMLALSLLLVACQQPASAPDTRTSATSSAIPLPSTAPATPRAHKVAAQQGAATLSAPAQAFAEPSGDFIRFERGPCYGRCPVFAATFTPDNIVLFAEPTRSDTKLTSNVTFTSLKTLLLQLQFFSLATRYDPSNKQQCALYATDHPSSRITARLNGQYHSVYHYHGCMNFPDQAKLQQLEQQLEQQLPFSNLQ